jgi:hypothetical protein
MQRVEKILLWVLDLLGAMIAPKEFNAVAKIEALGKIKELVKIIAEPAEAWDEEKGDLLMLEFGEKLRKLLGK